MSKFKVGDKVIRTGSTFGKAVQGETYVVAEVGDCDGLNLEGHPYRDTSKYVYSASNFKSAPPASKYLTPQQTLENLLTDVPTQAMHCGEWLDINELDNVSVNFLRSMKCRTKPSTVRVGEYEVVKPYQPTVKVQSGVYYSINLNSGRVHETSSRAFGYKWETREDAYAALQAIKKTLLGETK